MENKGYSKQNTKLTPKQKNSSVKFGVLNINTDAPSKDNNNNNSVVGMSSVLSGGKQDGTPTKNVKVVVPSFGTCSALFSQHFSILRELKKKIEKIQKYVWRAKRWR